MDACAQNAEHRLSRCDRTPIDDAVPIDDADRKTGEVIVSPRVHPGELRRFPADESAARLPAPLGNTEHDRLGDAGVQLSRREVVQKEEGFGARTEDIVHAHRDQVDPDRFVPFRGDCEFQFSPHPVGSRNENRVRQTIVAQGVTERKQGAKTTHPREDAGNAGGGGNPRDSLDEPVRSIDIDTRIPVADAAAVFRSHRPRKSVAGKTGQACGLRLAHGKDAWFRPGGMIGEGRVARNRVQLLAINPEHPEPHRIRQAVARLETGQNVVYPTDTIYGLAALMDQRPAVERLYRLRKLDRTKPLSLVCSDLSEVSRYAAFNNECFRAMKRVLPGPFTFILRATKDAPRLGQSKRKTVGIRIPDHPVAQALVAAVGAPLLSTSGLGDPGDDLSDPLALADAYAGTDVALVLDAGLLKGVPSTVIDWSADTPEVIREGAGDLASLA